MNTFTAANTSFGAISYVVVMGVDPELADYSNPRGERYGGPSRAAAEVEYPRASDPEVVSAEDPKKRSLPSFVTPLLPFYRQSFFARTPKIRLF